MEQREIKSALNRRVMHAFPEAGEAEYILQGVTIRKAQDGQYVYYAELLDIPSGGRGILHAPLETVRLSDRYFTECKQQED